MLRFERLEMVRTIVINFPCRLSYAPYGKGSGGSKKQAEQAAAKETLELLGEV